MALAHELRELRCLVAPLAVVPPHPAMVKAQLQHALGGRSQGGGGADGLVEEDPCLSAAAPAVVFVLGIDGALLPARPPARGMHPTLAPTFRFMHNNTRTTTTEDAWSLAQEVIAGLAPSDGDEDDDDGGGAGWRAATAHVTSCG